MQNNYIFSLFIGLVIAPFSILFAQFPTTGLVAHYPFAGNANDASSYANHATATNATLTTDRFGRVNNAYSFNGANSVVQAPDAPQLRPVNMTASVWVNNNSTAGFHSLAGKSIGTNVCDSWQLFIYGTAGGVPFAAVSCTNAGTGFTPFLVTPRIDNAWVHLVYVFDDDNNSVKLYKNNVLVQNDVTSGSIAYDTRPLMFGLTYEGGNLDFPFDGKIDDVRLYDRALSAAEISELYNESAYMAVNDGNWTSPATWAGGVVPPAGADIIISANVTVDDDVTVGNFTVSAGASLINGGYLMSVNPGSTFATADVGEQITFLVHFLGGATVSGTPMFLAPISISGPVNFGDATIGSAVRIKTGGSCVGVTPNYTSASIIYEPGGNFTSGLEWSNNSGSVQIINNTNFSFTGASERTCAGHLTVQAGSTLNLSTTSGGNLNLKAYLYMYGAFNSNERFVRFNQTGAEQWIYVGTTPLVFDRLELDAGYLTLFEGDVTVDDELKLTNGKPWAYGGDLILNSGATITGANNDRFIFMQGGFGLVMKGVTSAGKTFPVGINSGNGYFPVTIQPTATTDFKVVFRPMSNLPLDASKTIPFEWDIKPTTGSPGTTTMVFNPHSGYLNATNTATVLGLNNYGHYKNGSWQSYLSFFNVSNQSWTCVHQGYIGFSPFSVGAFGAFSAVLPIELTRFDAKIKESRSELTWQTANEANVKNFDIEKSSDGQKFEKFAEIKANNTPSVYQVFDNQFSASAYYRLKINELDGRSNFSKIIYLEKNDDKTIKIRRDTEGSFSVETDDKIELITVSNTVGQVLMSTKDKQFLINALNAGMYLISVKTDKGFVSQKIFKE